MAVTFSFTPIGMKKKKIPFKRDIFFFFVILKLLTKVISYILVKKLLYAQGGIHTISLLSLI